MIEKKSDRANDTSADEHVEWHHRNLPLLLALGMLATLLLAILLSALNAE